MDPSKGGDLQILPLSELDQERLLWKVMQVMQVKQRLIFFFLSLIRYAYPHEKKVSLNCPFGNRTEKKNIPGHMVLHMI